MTDLIEQNKSGALAEHPAAQTPMGLIEIAVQANADPDKLGKLMDLQERWEAKQAADAFGQALADFQAECPPVHKGRSIDLGRGAGPQLGGVCDVAYPEVYGVSVRVELMQAYEAGGKWLALYRVEAAQ